MYYAFQTAEKLYLVLGFEQGGELFTHLYKSEHFTEEQVQFYIAEIIVALEQLHKVSDTFSFSSKATSDFISSCSLTLSTEISNWRISSLTLMVTLLSLTLVSQKCSRMVLERTASAER